MNLMQTINFLFIPEALLSVIFLVIFFMLFGFGIWLYLRCKDELINLNKSAELMYGKVSNKISPETFIKAEIDKLSANEGVIEGIPDAFVNIGILATFIGLGVAIQGAAELLSTDTFEIEKLIDLLGIIAFKFQTSVWGILFSLLFRRFIVEQYFYYKQEIIDKVRERLYTKERDGIRILLEKQNDLLTKQFEYKQQINESRQEQTERYAAIIQNKYNEFNALIDMKLNDIINAQNTNHNDLINRQNAQYVKLIELKTQFHNEDSAFNRESQAKQFELLNKMQTERNEQLANNHESMIEHFEKIQQLMTDSDERMQTALNEQFNAVIKIHEELSKYINATEQFTETTEQFAQDTLMLNDYVENYRKTVENSFDKLTNTHKELSEKQSNILLATKQTIEDIEKIYIRCEHQYKQHIDDVQKAFLLKEDEYVQEMRNKLNNMFKITGETFRNNIAKISDDYNSIFKMTVENFKETLDNNIAKVSSDYNKVLNIFNENFNANIKKVNNDYVQELQHFGEVANSLSEAINGIDQKNQAAFTKTAEVINSFNTAAQQQITNISTIYNQMDTLLKNIAVLNQNAIKEQNETLQKFANTFTSIINSIQTEQLKNIESNAQKLNVVTTSIANLSKAVSTEQTQINDNAQVFQQNLMQKYLDMFNSISQTFKTTNDSLNNINKSINEEQNQLAESINNNNDLLLILQNNLNETLKLLTKQQKTTALAQSSDIAKLNTSIDDIRKLLNEQLKQMQVQNEDKPFVNSVKESTDRLKSTLKNFMEQTKQNDNKSTKKSEAGVKK